MNKHTFLGVLTSQTAAKRFLDILDRYAIGLDSTRSMIFGSLNKQHHSILGTRYQKAYGSLFFTMTLRFF